MSYGIRGSGFFGSDKLQTTTETMQEIVDFSSINNIPEHKHVNGFYRFNFDNKQDCTVFINGSDKGIFLEAGNQWISDIEDAEIKSFKVKEIGVTYKWVGHY